VRRPAAIASILASPTLAAAAAKGPAPGVEIVRSGAVWFELLVGLVLLWIFLGGVLYALRGLIREADRLHPPR
jgi:hypothetical protein